MIFAAKLLLVPAFLAVSTLVTRRYGPRVGGFFIALPLVSFPISIILTFEQGVEFTARAATGTLLALVTLMAFVVVQAHASRWGVWPSLLIGWGAYAAASWAINGLEVPPIAAFAMVVAAQMAALALLPKPQVVAAAAPAPIWDIPARMAVGAALVFGVTAAASQLGPWWSGYLSTFPVINSVLVAFTLALAGRPHALMLQRMMARSLWSFSACFLVLAYVLEPLGPLAGYALAAGSALTTHGILYLIESRRAG